MTQSLPLAVLTLSPAPRAQWLLVVAILGLTPQALCLRPLRGLHSATAVAILAGLGFVDFQRALAHFLAIEFLNGRRAFFLGRHLDKAKAARATGFTIFNHGYAFDCARLREHCLEIAARRVKREISDIKFHSHKFLTFSPCGVSHWSRLLLW